MNLASLRTQSADQREDVARIRHFHCWAARQIAESLRQIEESRRLLETIRRHQDRCANPPDVKVIAGTVSYHSSPCPTRSVEDRRPATGRLRDGALGQARVLRGPMTHFS